jgi:CRISPR-associated protein Cas2
VRAINVVWLLVMYDLPAVTDPERTAFLKFRNLLYRRGFQRLQWSVYGRPYPSERATKSDREAIERGVPPGGRVRLLSVTDMQFGKMRVVDTASGARRKRTPERALGQLVLL